MVYIFNLMSIYRKIGSKDSVSGLIRKEYVVLRWKIFQDWVQESWICAGLSVLCSPDFTREQLEKRPLDL